MISEIWDGFAAKMPPEDVIPSEGIEVFIDQLERGVELTTIKLPTPAGRNETYFIGLVKPKGGAVYRAFSLEYSISPMNGSIGTMLTESSNESRVNYGPGPEPQRDQFVAAVKEIVCKKKTANTFIKNLFGR